jgi:pyridoxine 5-phosphate synthase
MKRRVKLGVNIDHVATLRQARREGIPDLISAAKLAIAGGADSIVAHLREDRRHIQDRDIYSIRKLTCPSGRRETHFDLEMAATDEMLNIALKVRPDMATIVPEKREELTTEGGLDVKGNFSRIKRLAGKLEGAGIRVSLFIDPVEAQIKASSKTGATFIEIHTGRYACTNSKKDFNDIAKAAALAKRSGLRVNAGHGLDYDNAAKVAGIKGVEELNIGFSIIARSVFTGIKKAASDMKKLLMLFILIGLLCAPSYSATNEAMLTFELKTLVVSQEAQKAERQIYRDVPAEHWAASSVNNLVKLGVTQGYPDGTFRGENFISRYETSVFLSKLAHAGQTKAAVNEKLIEELRSEVYKLRYTLDQYKKPIERKRPVSGSFTSRVILGNIVSANAASSIINARLGPVVDYRLIASYRQEFDEDTYVRIGMDTMDSAVMGGRDFVKEMLEAEARVSSKWGLGLNMTSGPGLVIHREGAINIFPSEDYRAYLRPNNGIKLFYEKGGLDTGIGYKATAVTTSGAASINDTFAYVGYDLKNTFIGDVTVKYSFDLFNTDLRANYATAESTINIFEVILEPAKKTELGVKIGASSSQNSPHNDFASLSLVSRDLFRSGGTVKLFANKIGSDFFDYPAYAAITGVNLFDKLYQAATYDIGMEVSQVVSKSLSFRMIADIVTGPTGLYGKDEPKSNATFELDMDYGVFKDAVLTFGFRTYQNPSAASNATSDMLALGFRYNY